MSIFSRGKASQNDSKPLMFQGFVPNTPEEEKYLTVYELVKDLTPKQLENLKDAMTDIFNGVKKLAKFKTPDETINEADDPGFIEDISKK